MNLKNIKRYYILLRLVLQKNGNQRAEYIRKNKLFHYMGMNNYFHPWKIPCEGYLISIHDNVYVAANVTFLTHDVMEGMFSRKQKAMGGY